MPASAVLRSDDRPRGDKLPRGLLTTDRKDDDASLCALACANPYPPGAALSPLELIRACRATRGLTPCEKAVLCDLATYANADGTDCYPAIETIADDTSWSRSKVAEARSALVARGVLRKAGHSTRGTVVFSIVIPAVEALADATPIRNTRPAKGGKRGPPDGRSIPPDGPHEIGGSSAPRTGGVRHTDGGGPPDGPNLALDLPSTGPVTEPRVPDQPSATLPLPVADPIDSPDWTPPSKRPLPEPVATEPKGKTKRAKPDHSAAMATAIDSIDRWDPKRAARLRNGTSKDLAAFLGKQLVKDEAGTLAVLRWVAESPDKDAAWVRGERGDGPDVTALFKGTGWAATCRDKASAWAETNPATTATSASRDEAEAAWQDFAARARKGGLNRYAGPVHPSDYARPESGRWRLSDDPAAHARLFEVTREARKATEGADFWRDAAREQAFRAAWLRAYRGVTA